MSTNASDILVEHKDGMAILTLNRPATLNAMTFEMIAEFNRATAAAVANPEVRAIVITGTGRGFCSIPSKPFAQPCRQISLSR